MLNTHNLKTKNLSDLIVKYAKQNMAVKLEFDLFEKRPRLSVFSKDGKTSKILAVNNISLLSGRGVPERTVYATTA